MTEIGFGGASLGNLYRVTTDEEAAGAVRAAWDAGIRYFDTAPHYGLGLSEERLGRLLKPYPRDEYVLSTKVGRLLVPQDANGAKDGEGFAVAADRRRVWDFSGDGIRQSLHSSLKRLKTDHVDIVYAHDPDVAPDPDAALIAANGLIELRQRGDARAVGIGTNDAEAALQLLEQTDIDVVMLAGRYTLLEQGTGRGVLDAAERRGRSVVAVGVFNSGLLSTDIPEAGSKYNYSEAPPELVERARRLSAICRSHGTSLPAAAMAFPLRRTAVVNVTVGMRTAEQVARNVALAGAAIPESLWSDLVAAGLLPPHEA